MKQTQTHIHLVSALFVVLLGFIWPLHAEQKPKPLGLNTVCIDPGHGGKDPGCISPNRKYCEKDIVLSIGLELREKIRKAYPDVKVVMTRSDDRFIELAERAAIANRNDAKLFISIHVNSLDIRRKGARSVSGFSVHTLGQSSVKNRDLFRANMELCKRENSVILLEEDYSTTYQGFDPNDPESFIFFNLMQNANLQHSLMFAEDVDVELAKGPIKNNKGMSQNPFLVLWKTKMPSVLVETGFITNEQDCRQLTSRSGQKEIAEGIYRAFVKFKKRYDSSLNLDSNASVGKMAPSVESDKNEANEETLSEKSPYYGIQVLVSSKKMSEADPFFRGYGNKAVLVGKVYKYVVCPDKSLENVMKIRKEMSRLFPDSFVVKVNGNSIERVR